MRELCHRCQIELPPRIASSPASGSEDLLFCPHCSAPQIRLLEHMQTESTPAEATTGALAPPRPQQIDWRVALRCSAAVAAVGATLTMAGWKLPLASLFGTLWNVSCAILTLGLYARQRPKARMNARIGLRIGLMAGVLTVAALGASLAMAGLIARSRPHGMDTLDGQIAQQLDSLRVQIVPQMQAQHWTLEMQQKLLGFLDSPEFRGGIAIVNLGVLGGLLLFFSTVGGAFAGRLRTVREPLSRGE